MFYPDVPLQDLCSWHSHAVKDSETSERNEMVDVGLVCLYGSWNQAHLLMQDLRSEASNKQQKLVTSIQDACQGLDCRTFAASVQVDDCDESLAICIGDFDDDSQIHRHNRSAHSTKKIPPERLPAFAIVVMTSTPESTTPSIHLHYLHPSDQPWIEACSKSRNNNDTLWETLRFSISTTMQQVEDEMDLPVLQPPNNQHSALRIFVAGDRSSVGKSSVCLGILGSLLDRYSPQDLAYIKPATQSESTQLIQIFCQSKGIRCVPVGPIVYYRGFTRAFLAGHTESSQELLAKASRAVDRVARGKKMVLIDGVGFPAVGSIVGTSNAVVARACGYPVAREDDAITIGCRPPGVLLVGGSGVGAAVDAFNLNATFFESAGVPVMGAIFNKLSSDGFYSLENCKEQVSSYFQQYQPERRIFGFVPQVPPPLDASKIEVFLQLFSKSVDVNGILEAAREIKDHGAVMAEDKSAVRPRKRSKPTPVAVPKRSRAEIEQQAIYAGAAPSA